MKNTLLMLMLMFVGWTASSAQTGKDSIASYTQSELLKIADRTVRSRECDSLLQITEMQNQKLTDQNYAFRMGIAAKQKEVDAQKDIVKKKDAIIAGKDEEIGGLNHIIKKEDKKLRWTQLGWIATTGVLTFFLAVN